MPRETTYGPTKEPAKHPSNGLSTQQLQHGSYLQPPPAPGTCYLGTIALVVRSKNAGPYELTFDVMFDSPRVYQRVKDSGVLNEAMIARIYRIQEHDVIACLFWDQAMAFKATIVRPIVSGGFGESDVHGSQQHIPLLYVQLDAGIGEE